MTERPTTTIPGKVFITGASGFIGRALASRIRELGGEVAGVDLVADPANGVVAGTTTDVEPWADAVNGCYAVVHTAANPSPVVPLADAWKVNVLGTQRVMDAAIAAGVTRFVHISSDSVYGFDFPDGVDESYPVQVTGNSYIDTKVNAEAVVMTAHAAGELDCTMLRPANVYGPGSKPWVVLPLQLIKTGQAILPDGGTGTFLNIYIDNLVDAILASIVSPEASGQVFNLGDGFPVTYGEHFERLAAMAGGKVKSLPTRVVVPLYSMLGSVERKLGRPSELSADTVRFLNRKNSISFAKATEILGHQPTVSYDEGMARIEEWARAEGLI